MSTNEQSTILGEGGLPKVVIIAADGARAEVYLHGAHVTSWVPAGDTERLFVSPRSAFAPDSAIRGGIPVVFPQFANEGPLPKHGFARNMVWQLVSTSPNGADVGEAIFRLSSSAATEAIWPHAFVAELAVSVRAQTLDVALTVTNIGSDPLTFTAALHTYLRVADARRTVVAGLTGRSYRDSAAGGVRRVDPAGHVTIAGEVNRIYFDVTSPVKVEEPDRVTTVDMDGFTDVVVWNPGPTTASAFPDMEPDGYLRMQCIEAAAIGKPVTLAGGERWGGSQRLLAR